jgi:hypothetical protein
VNIVFVSDDEEISEEESEADEKKLGEKSSEKEKETKKSDYIYAILSGWCVKEGKSRQRHFEAHFRFLNSRVYQSHLSNSFEYLEEDFVEWLSVNLKEKEWNIVSPKLELVRLVTQEESRTPCSIQEENTDIDLGDGVYAILSSCPEEKEYYEGHFRFLNRYIYEYYFKRSFRGLFEPFQDWLLSVKHISYRFRKSRFVLVREISKEEAYIPYPVSC